MLFAWGPQGDPFQRLRDEMNRIFENRMLIPGWLERHLPYPRVNMTETPEELTVECELPGVAKQDLELSVEGDALTIRGERKAPEDREEEKYHRRERGFGKFERTLELPAKVDVDKIQAKFANGVLRIVMPKHPESQPKKIDVKVTEA
jgi:HSP20 family protein